MITEIENRLRRELHDVSVEHDPLGAEQMIAAATTGSGQRRWVAPLTAAAAIVAAIGGATTLAIHTSSHQTSSASTQRTAGSTPAARPAASDGHARVAGEPTPATVTAHLSDGTTVIPVPKGTRVLITEATVMNRDGDQGTVQIQSNGRDLYKLGLGTLTRTTLGLGSPVVATKDQVVRIVAECRPKDCSATVVLKIVTEPN